MEIARVTDNSIRVKGKTASLLFNPEKKSEEVAIFTKKLDDYSEFMGQVIIDGPGDYETSGISIKVDKYGEGLAFELYEEGQKLVILSSPDVVSSEVEDATAIVVFLSEGRENDVSKIACDILAVVGPETSLPKDTTNIKKADRINLRKAEEYKGFIVHLSK